MVSTYFRRGVPDGAFLHRFQDHVPNVAAVGRASTGLQSGGYNCIASIIGAARLANARIRTQG